MPDGDKGFAFFNLVLISVHPLTVEEWIPNPRIRQDRRELGGSNFSLPVTILDFRLTVIVEQLLVMVILLVVGRFFLAGLVVKILLSYPLLYQSGVVWDLTIHGSVKLDHRVPGLNFGCYRFWRPQISVCAAGIVRLLRATSLIQIDHDLLAMLLIVS